MPKNSCVYKKLSFPFDLDVSIGCAPYHKDIHKWNDWFIEADKQLYNEVLAYLSTILGQPEKQDVLSMGILTADWPGFHLECNDYRVAFERVFN